MNILLASPLLKLDKTIKINTNIILMFKVTISKYWLFKFFCRNIKPCLNFLVLKSKILINICIKLIINKFI